MTSEERHKARYHRRVQRRREKKEEMCRGYDDFNEVFSYKNLYEAYRKCRRNVSWKASVQKYVSQAPIMVNRTYKQLQNGKFRSKGFYEFDLNERGKMRHIKAVPIQERVVQRCLCDNAMVPVLSRTFIYDNAASLERKGYHFAIRRCCQHLREHYRKYGTEGYILLFDFRKFFDSVSHRLCKKIMREEFSDSRITSLTEHFIDCFGENGLGLGSQISQTFALASANRLDHFIKEVCRIHGYGRYMDDGYLIHRSKEYLHHCLDGIRRMCRALEITINEKKTHIVRITHGFTFLQARIYLSDTGRVVRKIPHKSVTMERRKLKRILRLVEKGKMTCEEAWKSFQSWRAYARNFRAYRTIRGMERLFVELFIGDGVSGDVCACQV